MLLAAGDRMTRDAWQSLVRARPGVGFRAFDGFYLHDFPLPIESLNEARILERPSHPEEILTRAFAHFHRGSPRWRLVCPPEWEALMEEACRVAGLKNVPSEPVMLLPSDRWRPIPEVAGFICRRVESLPTLRSFSETFTDINELPDFPFWESPGLLESHPWSFFLGLLEGAPVATGLGYTSEGITGLWGIATRSAVRGRGIGSAITWAVIYSGVQARSRAAYLWATEMGFPVYLKMGFRHVANMAIWTFERPP